MAVTHERVAAYWNQRAQGYTMRTDEELDAGFGTRFSAWLPKPEGAARLLDVGCGPGILALSAARAGWSVTGIDLSEGMLAQARERAASEALTVDFRLGDAACPDVPEASLDAVVNRFLLWHLPDPERALKNWVKALKPGGRLLVIDGNHYLHLYDELTAKVVGLRPECEAHSRKYTLDVDVSEAEAMAQELPLSSLVRPSWDMERVKALGLTLEFLEHKPLKARDPVTGEALECPGFFVWCARKPL